jgi:transcriptional regulator GlxA family with amidase domain
MCKDPAMAGSAPHEVAVIAVDRVVGFELGLPYRLLGLAEDRDGTPLYEVRIATLDGRPVRTADGFSVQPDHDGSVLRTAGTVIVPGIMGGPMVREGRIPPALAVALRDAAGHARMVSICTGSSVLAAAGLLDGRPAATHWRDVDAFRRNFPSVRLDPDVLFVDDGDVLTAAGSAAALDLGLHVIRRDHGAEVANEVSRRLVFTAHRSGGQRQFISAPVPAVADVSLAPVLEWLRQNVACTLTIDSIAAYAAVSPATLHRRFAAELGTTPLAWLTGERLALACRMLEHGEARLDVVARDCGLGTATNLRIHLKRASGLTPSEYRRRFTLGHTRLG